MIEIETPFLAEAARSLRAGERVAISGVVYTARDAAHARLLALLDSNQPLPFPLTDSIIYYVGPCPPPPGQIIGSAGPTTSSRMDRYTPRLLQLGLRCMIGKGPRSAPVVARPGAVWGGLFRRHRWGRGAAGQYHPQPARDRFCRSGYGGCPRAGAGSFPGPGAGGCAGEHVPLIFY